MNLSADLQERTGVTPVEVRTDARVAAAVGGVASIVAIAYLARAGAGGGWLDWALVLVTGAIAVAHLQSLVDARVPLLVADEHGVRLRKGRTWHGLPWDEIEHVEHRPRRGLFHDGRLVLVPREEGTALLAVPLSLSTRVLGADGDLTAALETLAGDPGLVVEEQPEPEHGEPDDLVLPDEHPDDLAEDLDERLDEDADEWSEHDLDEHDAPEAAGRRRVRDPRPAIARGIGYLAERLQLRRAEDDLDALDHADDADDDADLDGTPGAGAPRRTPHDAEPTVGLPPMAASATPLPLRDAVGGVRSEVRFEGAAALKADPADDDTDHPSDRFPEARELRRPGSVDLVEDTVVWSDRVSPIAKPGPAVEPLVIDDLAPAPALDPVIGPELAAARTRLGLSVDELADRTRIRPHVIESIEVDDFAPCGGDFYARGHLRTLARVLGVDVAPLLASYDERYADAPIDARRVFEAELATSEGGPIRSTRGGPNWSVLVAAVMAIVLAWSIVRLITDSPVELHSQPVLNGSPSSPGKLGPAVPVVIDASSGGAHVVVRDGSGEIVFNGDLAFGDSRTLKAAPPVRVQSSDGGLRVTVDGEERGPLGADGQPAQNTFAAAD